MDLAETVLKDIISPNEKKIITPEYIISTVAEDVYKRQPVALLTSP